MRQGIDSAAPIVPVHQVPFLSPSPGVGPKRIKSILTFQWISIKGKGANILEWNEFHIRSMKKLPSWQARYFAPAMPYPVMKSY